MIGYLEESEGVKSSTRLFGAVLIALTALQVVTICAYVLWLRKDAGAGVIGALVAGVGATCAQGAVAIGKRNVGTDER